MAFKQRFIPGLCKIECSLRNRCSCERKIYGFHWSGFDNAVVLWNGEHSTTVATVFQVKVREAAEASHLGWKMSLFKHIRW